MTNLNLMIKRFMAGLRFGSGFTEKAKAACGLVYISRLSRLTFVMELFGKKQQVVLKTGSDAATFVEVFLEQEYALPENFKPKTIIDLGSNIGFASIYFNLRDPQASITALEPDPSNLELLAANAGRTDAIKIIPAAIAATAGTQIFYPRPQQGMSSSFIKHSMSKPISVITYSLDSLLDFLKLPIVDLVKFDIEGAEWDVFSTADLKRINNLIGEYHGDLTGRKVNEFIALFPGFQSSIRKLSSNRSIIFLYR